MIWLISCYYILIYELPHPCGPLGPGPALNFSGPRLFWSLFSHMRLFIYIFIYILLCVKTIFHFLLFLSGLFFENLPTRLSENRTQDFLYEKSLHVFTTMIALNLKEQNKLFSSPSALWRKAKRLSNISQ